MTVNSVIDSFQLTRSLFQQPAKARKNAKHNPRIDSLMLARFERFPIAGIEMHTFFGGVVARMSRRRLCRGVAPLPGSPRRRSLREQALSGAVPQLGHTRIQDDFKCLTAVRHFD